MNFLWIDVETTGIYSDKHDVVQLACIPVVDGVVGDFFNEFCKPKNWDAIEDAAIKVHGITREKMLKFQSQEELLNKLIPFLKKYNTRFVIAGYNVDFDKRFLADMFSKCQRPQDFFSIFELHTHDVYKRAKTVKSLIKTENLKLETLAKHYGISIKAHDAYSDIDATIKVDVEISKLLGEEQRSPRHSIKLDPNILREFDDACIPEPPQLHLHSMYGMVESIPSVGDWAKWCKDNGIPGFSIVDHGPASSILEILDFKDDGLTPVPGVGLYFKIDGVDYLNPFNAWAINNDGYFNIMKMSSLAYKNQIEEDGVIKPIISIENIKKHSDGVIFGTGDVYGSIGEFIKRGNLDSAKSTFYRYVDIFSKNILVEFSPISIRETYSTKKGFQPIGKNSAISCGDLGKSYNNFMFNMMSEYGLKGIPCSSAHFINKDDKLLQDIVAKNSYSSGKYYIESHHVKKSKELYLSLKEQLGEKLTLDMYRQWVDNSISILDMAKNINTSYNYHLPKIDIPDDIKSKTSNYDEQTLLYTIRLCKKHGRWRNDKTYVDRFKKEINVIMNNGVLNFLPYFLLYEDIGSFARSRGVLQNIGRGSAGGCLLSYYLKIIHIDPIEADLPFERFLSFARIKKGLPDIDSDFGDRSEIIKYLFDKYKIGFSQICTFQKMKTKNAIKDAMWALYGKNRKDPNVEAICKLIPDSPQGVDEYDFLYGFTNKEGEYTPGIIEQVPEIQAFFKQFSQVEKMVKRLIGLIRGWGRHASAYVVSTLDLSSERVPTMEMYDKHLNSMISVTQCEASIVEKVGLLKADILGVTTIQAVSDCIKTIRDNTGIDYLEEDENGTALIYRLPEDIRVYEDFYNKKTDSSFQFNTSTVKAYIQEIAPTSREELSETTALLRPGALDAKVNFDAVTKVEYDDGTIEYHTKDSYREWLSKMHNQ